MPDYLIRWRGPGRPGRVVVEASDPLRAMDEVRLRAGEMRGLTWAKRCGGTTARGEPCKRFTSDHTGSCPTHAWKQAVTRVNQGEDG